MSLIIYMVVFSVCLFIGMLLFLELGYRLGRRPTENNEDAARSGSGTVEATVFGLLGLIIAFTFGGAVSRFDARRDLIVQEANAIGTAYLRLDLLPAGTQPELRESFRHYLDARLRAYERLPDMVGARASLAEAERLQRAIWSQAQSAGRSEKWMPAAMLILPAINEMIDITSTRTMATWKHPPLIVWGLLFVLAMFTSLLVGYGMAGIKGRRWLHRLIFAAVVAVTVYVILDVEYPRVGLIRVDAADRMLTELRASMK